MQSIRAAEVNELIHFDVAGPMPVASLGGARYFATFTDDFSRHSHVVFLKHKSELFREFVRFKMLVEKQQGFPIKRLRCDNAGENLSGEFQSFVEREGLIWELTMPYTPQQNGVAERLNRTLLDKAISMLKQAKLPKSYWAYAVKHACLLKNVSPTVSVKGRTPFEIWNGRRPNLSNLRVFGCRAFVHVPRERRDKLDSKSVECVFVGIAENRKGFVCINPRRNTVVVSRDVSFHENEFGVAEDSVEDFAEFWITVDLDDDSSDSDTDEIAVGVPAPAQQEPRRSTRRKFEVVDFSKAEDVLRHREELRQSEREEFANVAVFGEPTSFDEAMRSEHSSEWQRAAEEEMKSLEKNETWELAELPPGRVAVKSKWVFKTKLGEDGEVVRYKARLVARG